MDLGQLSCAVQNFNVLNNGYQGNSWTYNAYVNTSNNAARNASLNTVQTALTVAGLVPGLGSPADIANAGISALRGDYTAASISLSAAFIGSVANKVDNGVGAVASASTVSATPILDNVINSGIGFNSKGALRNAMTLGPDEHLHHIVEQTPSNLAKFGVQAIQNTANAVPISADIHIGSGSISAYYSSIDPGVSADMTVRKFLRSQSFDYQYSFGLQVLQSRGVIR